MKRIITIVLFFILVSAGLFAQNDTNFKFVWDVGMDFDIVDAFDENGNPNGKDVLLTPRTRYTDPNQVRMFYMQMGCEYATPTWGVNFKYYFSNHSAGRSPQIYTTYGWFKTFDEKLLINMGWIENDIWATKGGIPRADEFALDGGGGGLDVGEGSGVQFNLNPILGLNIGAAVYTRNDRALNILDNKFVLALNYEMEGVFSFQSSFANKSTPTEIIDFEGILCAGLSFDLIDNFTLIVDGMVSKFNSPELSIYQTIGYKINALEFGVLAAEEIKMSSEDMAINVFPWVSFAIRNTPIGIFVPRLQAGIYNITDSDNMSFQISPRLLWVTPNLPRVLLGYDTHLTRGDDDAFKGTNTIILNVYWSY